MYPIWMAASRPRSTKAVSPILSHFFLFTRPCAFYRLFQASQATFVSHLGTLQASVYPHALLHWIPALHRSVGRHVLTSLPGSNLSQGQRQLVSLARAMLTPSNILVLDEATAAVDVQTDALLQQTLRGPMFSNRTIITVAHRINTILDSDRVVVLQRGEVAEFDTPENLIKDKGIFYSLVKEAGLTE